MEIVVGLALLVLALVGIYGLVRGSMQSFGFSEDFLEVQQNARVALSQIAEEAKWARSVETGTPACPRGVLDPQCLSLQIPANPLRERAYRVSYRWNGTTRQLERVEEGEEGEELAVLADYVTEMTITYRDKTGQETSNPGDVVRIVADLVLKRRTAALAQEVNVGSDIFLRNAAPIYGPPPPTTPPPSRTPPATSTKPPYTPPPSGTPAPGPSRTPRRTHTPRPTPPPTPTPTVRPR